MTAPLSPQVQRAAVSEPRLGYPKGAGPTDGDRRTQLRRLLAWGVVAAICVCALIDWFSAKTQRLYVDESGVAARQEGTVWQHFALRGNEVVPEIISRDEARFTFPVSLRAPHSLRFTAHPDGAAEYAIVLRQAGTSRQIAARKIDRPFDGKISLPAGNAALDFIVHGRIAWFDLRLTRSLFLWPFYALALIAAMFALRVRGVRSPLSPAAGNWLALGGSTLICLALTECVLRLVALKLPPALLTARHHLGLSAPDPRWIESPRYRKRLAPNLKTYCEWEHGDIVRMGGVAPDVFGAEPHRYPFETDAEGFRNPAVREQIDVAALGDSFVDAMTSPAEEAWPARLEQITEKKVQNYGTSSFGPQQELYVLEDFALHHQPRDVVLGFFGANDFFDAERFDNWEKGRNQPGEEPTGWRLTKTFRRYEMLYLTTLIRVALPGRVPRKKPERAQQDTSRGPRFDRGRYDIPVPGGGELSFAFMPPYLQKLASSRPELERSRGWELIRASLLRMRDVCTKQGSRFSVMFIPSKAAVYWPLVEQSLGLEELQRSLDFASSFNRMPLRAADLHANRFAQNELMRDFCARENIPFLDLTPALEQSAAAGRAVYFPDDAHWNAAGHEVAAQALSAFLAREP